MKQFRSFLFGLVLVVLGVIIGLNTLHITNINIFFEGWWTLIIIIPCFIGLFNEKDKTGNLIGILIGLLLLLSARDILDFSLVWKLFIPIVLVMIGISVMFKGSMKSDDKSKIKKISKSKLKDEYCAVFSAQEIIISDEQFDGCELDCVFGSLVLDLKKAKFKKDAYVELETVFGKSEIILPKEVNVVMNSTPIFGSGKNEHKNLKENKITLYIETETLFGSVNIK